MTDALKKFRVRAFAKPGVKQAYDELAEEFSFLDEVLKARADAGRGGGPRRHDAIGYCATGVR